jgi:hypothetical protein
MEATLKSQEEKPGEICIPSHISQTFVRQHEDYTFVYGYDVRKLGMEGQPWVFVGEPNAFPVPVLVRYCPSSKTFFNDAEYNIYKAIIDDWISVIPLNKPVIPCPKIGMGCSRLNEIAPILFSYLTKKIDAIKYPNIRWITK